MKRTLLSSYFHNYSCPSHYYSNSIRFFHASNYLLAEKKQNKSDDTPWKNVPLSNEFWDFKPHQKKYLDYIFKTQNYTSQDDWYKIKKADFTGNAGKTFLAFFENSVADAVISVYGEKHQFYHWKFPTVPSTFWEDGNNQRKYMEWLGNTLKYSTMSDWYAVGVDDFVKNGGRGLLNCYSNSVQNALEFVFPEHGWLSWKFQKLPSGYWDNIDNTRQFLNWMATDLKFQSMEDWLRVDIETLKKYDVVRVLSKYGNLRKLLTTAYPSHPWHIKPKPRVVEHHSPPSPSLSSSSPPQSSSSPSHSSHSSSPSPSSTVFKSISSELPSLEDEPQVERFVYNWSNSKFSLESKWSSSQDPSNWIMFPNPGGMRVIWESKARKFYTQTGGVFTPPPHFAKKLPRDYNLDGTLTCVEGKVQHCVNTHIRAHLHDWSGVTFNIIDIPVDNMPIEKRISLIQSMGIKEDDNVNIVQCSQCENMPSLLEYAKQLSQSGVDSILLKPPSSQYEKGKTDLFQRAVIYQLQPAIVTSAIGPFIMKCTFPDGTDFAISHAFSEPPAIGSVVMVKYGTINEQGQPRDASVIPWEEPINWDDVNGKTTDYGLALSDIKCP